MNGFEALGAVIAFVGLWGSLWYKLGKVESEVKHHNSMLKDIQKQIEHVIIRGGN